MRSLLVGSSVMQSRDLVSVSRRVSRTVFCSLGLGLEGFWSQSRALRLETLHRLFFMTFCKKFLKTVKNDCSTFSRSKRSVAKLSLVLCYLRDGENNLPSTPFKIYTEFSTKCVGTNETATHNLCNEMLRVLCSGLSLNCFSRSFGMKLIGLFEKGGRVPKSFFIEKLNKTMSFLRSAFQSTLLKHDGEAFFFLRNANFFTFKNASELF